MVYPSKYFRFPVQKCVLLGIFWLVSGCAGQNLSLNHRPEIIKNHCDDFYSALDHLVTVDQVEDSGEVKLSGYPFLRTNRFLASFAGQTLSQEAFSQWLTLLRELDEQARILEYGNLSSNSIALIKQWLPPQLSFQQTIKECGQLLINAMGNDHLSTPDTILLESVPDHYQTWKRALGLYPLVSRVAESRIDVLHQKLNQPFQVLIDKLSVTGQLYRYRANPSFSLTQQTVGRMLRSAYRNPLQLPLLEAEQLTQISAHFAPVWEIDTRNNSDKVGTLKFDKEGMPSVDTSQPAVYVQHAYTRYHGENLLQLIYQIWLPAREKTGWLDLYGGDLDSVIWRVTLNRQGVPIAYDSIHACGCYYLLFPGSGYQVLPRDDETEAVLSPRQIDIDPYAHKLVIRLASRTHYLQGLSTDRKADQAIVYDLIPYSQLRSLELPSGGRRNLFGQDGIIEHSARQERFLLWPFGVASPGAMRQWGSHAIAFIGRRHFDDPFLLEKLIAPAAQ
jgi:hypothetical protein